jgi:hypothetical protein
VADDIGGLQVDFTAEASQLQAELRRVEQQLRAFDRSHGRHVIRVQAELVQPGQRRLEDFRRDIQGHYAGGKALSVPVRLQVPARQEMDRFSSGLAGSLRPITVKVRGVWDGWEKPPPTTATINVRGGGGGGAGGAAAAPRAARESVQAPAATVVTAPRTRDEVHRAREEARRRERTGAVAASAPAPRPQTAAQKAVSQFSANEARAKAQVKTASRQEVFADWDDQTLLSEYLDTQRRGGSKTWMAKAERELISRGFNPRQGAPGAGGARGFASVRGPAAGGGGLPHYSTTGVFPPAAATVGAMGRRGELTMPIRDIYDPYARNKPKRPALGVKGLAGLDEEALYRQLHQIVARATPEGIAAGRGWYGRAGGIMSQLGEGTGGSRSQVIGAGAVFSTNASWSENIRNAQDFFDAIRDGATTFREIAPRVKTTNRIIETALSVFNTPDDRIEARLRGAKGLKNPKLTEFYRGLSGDPDAFTVDRHQAIMMGGRPIASDLRVHAPFQRAGRRVAKDLGWSAADVQAVSWVTGLGHEIAGADPYGMQQRRTGVPRGMVQQMAGQLRQPWGGFTLDPRTGGLLQPTPGRKSGPFVSAVGETTSLPIGSTQRELRQAIKALIAANPGQAIGGFHDIEKGSIDLDVVRIDESRRQAIATQRARGAAARGAYDVATGNGVFAPQARATPAGAPNIAAFSGSFGRSGSAFATMGGAGAHIDPVTGTPIMAAQTAYGEMAARERTPSEAHAVAMRQRYNREQAAQQRMLARWGSPQPGVGIAAFAGRSRLSGAAQSAMGRIGDPTDPATFLGAGAAGPAAGPAPAVAAKQVARKLISEAVYDIGGRQYNESDIPPAIRRSLSEDDLRAARIKEAKYEAEKKAVERNRALGAPEAGPASLSPALLARLGVGAETDPRLAAASGAVSSARLRAREVSGAGSVRAVGTTLAQSLATLVGGRAEQQEQIATLRREEGLLDSLRRKSVPAITELSKAETAHKEALAASAPEAERLGVELEGLRAKHAPLLTALDQQTEKVTQLSGALKPGGAAVSGLAASMVGSIAGMFLFSTVTGAITAAGEKLAPVLQENADRVSGFQTNANRMRETLSESVRELRGYSDLAVSTAGANIGMSRSTLQLIRPTLAADAAIEAGNKNLEARIEMLRAFQGIQTRQAGLGGLAGLAPAGVTQTQGGLNLFGLQTPIGGTPSTFEQLGRQFQFGATPAIDWGKALGFGQPRPGELPFDFNRDFHEPARGGVAGAAAFATRNIPFVGDFFKSMKEQIDAQHDAANGTGEFTDEMAAGAAVLRTDFNDAVKRAGDSSIRMAEVTNRSRSAQEAQIAALEGSGIPSLFEFAQGLRAGRTVLEGIGEPGQTAASQQQFLQRVLRGGAAFARGSTIADPQVVAEQMSKSLSASLQMIDWQSVMQRGTILPGQQYLSGLASGRLNVGGTPRALGIRELPPEVAATAPNFEKITGELTDLQKQQSSVAQTGRTQLLSMLRDADSTMGHLTGSTGSLTSQFKTLETSIGANAGAMRSLQIENTWAQANLQVAQYDEQIRVANRSLQDAISFQTGLGHGELGLLQYRARNLEISAAEVGFRQQELGLQSQQLGLQEAGLGIRSRELALMQSQRQINFQRSLAGFVTPGASPEEIAARQAEAKIEADFAQQQQDIAVESLGVTRQQVDLQAANIGLAREGLAIAREQFNVQQAMITVNASRAITDLSNQLDLLSRARTVTLQVAVNNEAIAAYQEAIERDTETLQSVIQQAYQVQTQIMQGAAQLAAEYGGTLQKWNTMLLDRLNEYVNGVGRVFSGSWSGSPPTGGGGGGGGAGNQLIKATGYQSNVASPTTITVGEAGPETVAILRNPRTTTMAPSGGGGALPPIVIDVHDNQIGGSSEDTEAFAAMIARKVEETMSRKSSLLGLRGR